MQTLGAHWSVLNPTSSVNREDRAIALSVSKICLPNITQIMYTVHADRRMYNNEGILKLPSDFQFEFLM